MPISATGAEPLIRRSGQPRAGGFTLIEIIVVLAIMGFALAVVPANMARLYDGMQYRSAVAELISGLKAARNAAIRSGSDVALRIDTATGEVSIGGTRSFTVPAPLRLGMLVADREIDAASGAIRFYADGGSTGGSIVLRRPNGGGVRLQVDWLLGQVLQEPLG